MKYKERKHSATRRTLCLIMAITMLLPVSNLWALEIGIQLLDGGESLTVSSGETVTADDADVRTTSRDGSDVDSVTAVRGDDTDSEYVFNGDVTIEESGSISATITEDSASYTNVFAQGIEADEGNVTVANDGEITASAIIKDFDEPHAIGVMIHNFNAAVLENPTTEVINNGSIVATAIQENNSGAGATARGIQTGGGDINTFENLTITNNDGATITVYAESKNESASARGIKTGGNIEGLSIINAGSIDTTATAKSYDANARGIQTGGYITPQDDGTIGLNIENSGSITASATADKTDYDANAQGIHTGDYIEGLSISNTGDITVDATGYGANARGIHAGESATGLDIDNEGLIQADATATWGTASAAGIMSARYSEGDISNSGTVKATATNLADDDYGSNNNAAEATAIKLGQESGDDDTTSITNEEGGLVSATAIAESQGIAAAKGIHAGYNAAGLITNYGTIEALAQGGNESKAFAVQAGGGMVLENLGTISSEVDVQESDNIDNSWARGVFASDMDDEETDVNITNKEDGVISATSNHTTYGDSYSVGAIGVHVGYDQLSNVVEGDDMTQSRSVTNEGTIEATSTLSTLYYSSGNTGAIGIKTGEIYVYGSNMSYASPQTITSELILNNSGSITAQSTIEVGDYLESNAGAFGIRSGQNYLRNYSTDNTSIAGNVDIDNSGDISVETTIDVGTYISDSVGAFGIKAGQTYVYDPYTNVDTTSTATTDINNSGNITATSEISANEYISESSGAYGIRSGYTAANGSDTTATATTTITNTGDISATTTLTSPEMYNSNGAYGIRVGDDSNYAGDGNYNVNVTNEGTITANATIDTDYEDSTNHNRGAFGIRTGTAMVVNSGDITTTATMNGLNDSAYDGAYGIRSGEGDSSIVHSGTISATLTDNEDSTMQRAVGIMTGQSDNIIHLSGSVAATATGGDAYSVVMGCENSGGSDNFLVIMDGASLTGNVLNAGDGVAEVILGAAKDANDMGIEGQADSAFDFSFDGSFLGNETYDIPAYWNANFVGGTLTGNIVIDGNYSQSAGTTYRALLGDGAAAELEISGEADFSEDAVIEIGTAGYVADGSVHTIVNSATLTPAADADQEALLTESALVLDYSLVEGEANKISVLADRASYASIGVSSNAVAVSTALIAMAGRDNSEANSYIGQVDSCSTVGCINEGYAALAPEQYPALLDISQSGNAAFGSVINGRMGNLHIVKGTKDMQFAESTITKDGPVSSRLPAFDNRATGWSSWARVFGVSGEQDRDGALQGFEYDSYGISVGADNKISDTTAIGFGLGYADTEADFENNSQGSDIESIFASVYGTYSVDSYYVDAAVTYASNDYDSVRAIPLASLNASSSTDGKELGMMIGAGCKAIDVENMYFIPTASLSWGKLDIDGFTETGAGTFNLEVDDFDATSFMTTLGFRWGATMGTEGKFEPELRLAWAHEFGDTDRDTRASFAGQPESFMIKAVERESDSAIAGLGVNYYFKENVTLYLDYDGEYRDGYDAHALSGGFRYNF